MSERPTVHASFTIERVYEAAPARVFDARADPAAKARWFGPGTLSEEQHRLDFRVGGQERLSLAGPDGAEYTFDALYRDVVAGQRIVYAYDMYRDGVRMSVSLATVELLAEGAATRLVFTEQAALLDGADTPEMREEGTRALLDKLAGELEGAAQRA